ncbi:MULTISPECIES: hypothetical protein [unclassified Streptomyces]|nr:MULTISPECIES: hypothetical protein [unclassified Streptomyces]
MTKRPWLPFGWPALAALVVGGQHCIPQPWSAVVIPWGCSPR